METMQNAKVTVVHLKRDACIYIRQSSLRQVMDNTESARRQYALNQRARALGWPINRIRMIDEDQGKSGASSDHREGFRDLMGRIAGGEVGLVLSIEVSRLSRDNADWHQLLRVAALSGTLIGDETGIYSPADSNDRLLPGIKGTISEFELLGIRARMMGGLQSAAARGALKLNLPTGLVYNDNDEVVLDPDQSIVDAFAGVFDNYRRLGSAAAVVRWMHQEDLTLPARVSQKNHPSAPLRWSSPTNAQICRILQNPRYAGAYVYGRKRHERQPDGTCRARKQSQDQWQVCIIDAHVGYISWEQFQLNQEQLVKNLHPFASAAKRNKIAPRNGAALLSFPQLVCARCGRSMGPVYKRVCTRNAAPYYYTCHGSEQSSSDCQMIRGDIIDAALGEFVIDLMNHNNIDLAVAVNQLVRDEFARADALRMQQIDRLRYQCDQAQRRFFAVDPDHRLVAASLEAKWENCLSELNHATAQREAIAEKHDRETAMEQSTRLHEITRDFSLVWHAPQTQPRERKQLLGFAIEDVTLLREDYTATISLRLRGGQTVTLNPVSLPKPSWMAQQTPPETIEKISQLAPKHLDCQIAEHLNLDGCRTWNDELYTAKKVQAIRKRKAIPGFVEIRRQALRDQGYISAGEVARRFGVSNTIICHWGRSPNKPWIQTSVIHSGNGKHFNMYKIHHDMDSVPECVHGKIAKNQANFVKPTKGAL